mmetsp:Transcript_2910/g.4857  ORF Transcript_2910/g.4857 Transcript_2910/m.4857 type:complete len:383 (+) Transcript_2910:571-1719(+)
MHRPKQFHSSRIQEGQQTTTGLGGHSGHTWLAQLGHGPHRAVINATCKHVLTEFRHVGDGGEQTSVSGDATHGISVAIRDLSLVALVGIRAWPSVVHRGCRVAPETLGRTIAGVDQPRNTGGGVHDGVGGTLEHFHPEERLEGADYLVGLVRGDSGAARTERAVGSLDRNVHAITHIIRCDEVVVQHHRAYDQLQGHEGQVAIHIGLSGRSHQHLGHDGVEDHGVPASHIFRNIRIRCGGAVERRRAPERVWIRSESGIVHEAIGDRDGFFASVVELGSENIADQVIQAKVATLIQQCNRGSGGDNLCHRGHIKQCDHINGRISAFITISAHGVHVQQAVQVAHNTDSSRVSLNVNTRLQDFIKRVIRRARCCNNPNQCYRK